MQLFPLSIGHILRHGSGVHGGASTFTATDIRRASFGEVAARTGRLAAALHRLGVRPGDCVGTFGWNHQEHLEPYDAVPCMGAVLHTLNIRLFTDQLTYVINHGGDLLHDGDHPRPQGRGVQPPLGVPACPLGVLGGGVRARGEPPLGCVVLREPTAAGPRELCDFLSSRVAGWWLPERWAFVDAIPKTSVGKFDKKALRARYSAGNLPVEVLPDRAQAR
jgi:acyl-CoA synthetase (AMP-forming)/AMP-acid ligase II